jgi:hypothetical protein
MKTADAKMNVFHSAKLALIAACCSLAGCQVEIFAVGGAYGSTGSQAVVSTGASPPMRLGGGVGAFMICCSDNANPFVCRNHV